MSEMKLFRVSNQRWKLILGVVFLVVEALLLASMISRVPSGGVRVRGDG
ncbi:MAG: hypothetical protein M0R80_31765 [Proteobacteria bacterium]|jgi:hypothetical protein|nr:hypothetical protein [Pseudomonadota bacterium]